MRRRDGTHGQIAPCEITDKAMSDNPWVALDALRPDFNGALIQFLIGLIQTAISPKTDREWRMRLVTPPSREELEAAFYNVKEAFELFGNGPRFMQDLELIGVEEKGISALLIDAPGTQTLKKNCDFFVKRGCVERLCPACVAMALFTLQINAPSGGQGHRTSLRGGGPLTTVILGNTLWQTIWLNTLCDRFHMPPLLFDSTVFPWLGPTRLSDNDELTTPADVHELQVFWGTPRRIRLGALRNGPCSLCGSDLDCVNSYFTKNYGVNYKGGWLHPLTPYSRYEGKELNPRKGGANSTSYRYWLGMVQTESTSQREPALVVHEFSRRSSEWGELHEILRHSPRLWAFGYETDNMKACGWYEGTMPLVVISEEMRTNYEAIVERCIYIAAYVASCTRSAIKKALFRRPNDIGGDLSVIDRRFWSDTEQEFYLVCERARVLNGDIVKLKLGWLRALTYEANRLFDEQSQIGIFMGTDPKRIAHAHNELHAFISANGKKVRKILDLPAISTVEKKARRVSNKRFSQKKE